MVGLDRYCFGGPVLMGGIVSVDRSGWVELFWWTALDGWGWFGGPVWMGGVG